MKLFVVRHGETDWNVKNKVLGRTDIPLNANGWQQAANLAEDLQNACIDVIYTSPLQRAKTTGEKISELQAKGTVRVEKCLIEQDFGNFEGVDRGETDYQAAKREYFKRYPSGESYFDVAARVYPFLDSLKDRHPEQTVLIVTHGGICRIINSYFNDMDNEEFSAFVMPNCGYMVYEL